MIITNNMCCLTPIMIKHTQKGTLKALVLAFKRRPIDSHAKVWSPAKVFAR